MNQQRGKVRGRGRPPLEKPRTRVELRLDDDLVQRAADVAQRAGFPSVNAWLTTVITRAVDDAGVLGRPVAILDPSPELAQALARANASTVGDVVRLAADELFGPKDRKVLAELRRALDARGLRLRGES